MKINKTILIIILAVSLAGIIFLTGSSTSLKSVAAVPELNKTELIELIEQQVESSSVVQTEQWSNRNPFVVSISRGGEGFNLFGIFLGSNKPSAIINNTVVKVGDSINGMLIKDIKNENIIVVDASGRQRIFSIKEEFSAQDVSMAQEPSADSSVETPAEPPVEPVE